MDGSCLSDDLCDGPEGDSLPVGEAAPVQHLHPTGDVAFELGREARLSRARRPHYRNELAALFLHGLDDRASKGRELRSAGHERRVHVPGDRSEVRCLDQAVRRDPLGLALEL